MKEKINLLINKKISIQGFDKWIVNEYAKNKLSKFYKDILDELLTELEGLRVDFLDSIKWRKTTKDKVEYKKTTYP